MVKFNVYFITMAKTIPLQDGFILKISSKIIRIMEIVRGGWLIKVGFEHFSTYEDSVKRNEVLLKYPNP